MLVKKIFEPSQMTFGPVHASCSFPTLCTWTDWPSVIPGFNFLSVDLTWHSTHVLSRIKMINSFFIVWEHSLTCQTIMLNFLPLYYFNNSTIISSTFCLFFRLIHVCLSNNEVLLKWMDVLETETVFKNLMYILENSLNGEFFSYW